MMALLCRPSQMSMFLGYVWLPESEPSKRWFPGNRKLQAIFRLETSLAGPRRQRRMDCVNTVIFYQETTQKRNARDQLSREPIVPA